jgi:CheY-like chemotaxis protein
MPRILLIDPDRSALAVLQAALRRAGVHDVAAATSGSFALTMLERNRPDLVVSRVAVPDIDGYELCSIIRKDPSMTGVRFLLLAGPHDDEPEARIEEKPDQLLAGDVPIAAIVSEATRLLRATPAPPASGATPAALPASPASPPPTPATVASATPAALPAIAAASPEPAGGLRGSLGVMDLPDITQAIALGNKTGHLMVTLSSGRGVIVFDRGRVVHAEFFGLIGEIAFVALLAVTQGEGHGNFAFNPSEPGTTSATRTIHRDLKQLLLSVAAELDEGRPGTAVAPLS